MEKGNLKKLVGISESTRLRLAKWMGLGPDTPLGNIVKKAREEWAMFFPEIPASFGVKPKGTDVEVLNALALFDGDRTLEGETEEMKRIREELAAENILEK